MEDGKALSATQLTLLTSCMAGVQICYAAQTNLGTPQLLLLGLPARVVSFAWLAGPLSGLIVQPLVGRWSDRTHTTLGRRRPFLLGGAILTSCAMLLFANAAEVARSLRAPKAALPLAIVAFFLLDFCVQAVQAPLRMLVTDIVPAPQRAAANSLLATFTGVGLLLGGLLTGVELERYLPVFNTHAQALFAVAAAFLMCTTLLCVAATREKLVSPPTAAVTAASAVQSSRAPLEESQLAEEHSLLIPHAADDVGAALSWYARLRAAPFPYWQCFAVQLCTWVGFFSLFVYVSAWVGTNIYLGDGSAPAASAKRQLFDQGVLLAGRANALQALVTIAYSFIIPAAWRTFGVRAVYVVGQAVQAITLLAAPFIRGPPTAATRAATMLDLGAYGVVWATTMSVPWTLIGGALASDLWYSRNVGLFQTIFNASQSGPQLVVAVLLAPVVLAFAGDDPAWVMFTGGVFAAVGMALVVLLDVREGDWNASAQTG